VDTTITTIEMCAGYGGIGLGLKNIFGDRMRTLAYCELEGFAQANIVSKMEKGLMDVAPLWNDLKTFPYESFHGLVDILIAGYPCQPFSSAGKRAGKEDPRHLWPWIADGIRLLQPRMCFFENVEGHISLGLREVIGELEQIGYKSSWGIFSAAEVGAPHQRKRVFILAVSNSLGGAAGLSRSSAWNEGVAGVADHGGGEGCGELADTRRIEPQGWCGAADGQQSGAGRIPRGEPAPCHDQVWPSRPGEAQHGWEPPRVVANSNSTQPSEGRGNNGEVPQVPAGEWTDECAALSGGEGEPRGEEVVGNSTTEGLQGCGTIIEVDRESGGAEGEGSEPSPSPAFSSNAHGRKKGVGNTIMHGHAPTQISGGTSESKAERGLQESEGGSASVGNTASQRPQERPQRCNHSPIQATECGGGSEGDRQAQPPLGGVFDGSAGGLGYAELCVSCDNRTDELRLLGNGVVPATAERAFRTLLTELITK